MIQQIYYDILEAKKANKKLLAVLLDPDKLELKKIPTIIAKINESSATHIFVGGSIVANGKTANIVSQVKNYTVLPIVLFPGDVTQITENADALLFLSLLSGRNPEFLIDQQIRAVPIITKTTLEVIPTGYILIDGGVETAVQKVSKTTPIAKKNISLILNTALAGQYMGKKLIYLEAGSGAKAPVGLDIIEVISKKLNIPIIVGGGIRSKQQLLQAFKAGADMVVIGTAFEENINLFSNNF